MLSAVSLLFGGAAFLIWMSYRRARAAAAEGSTFAPEGRIRWEASESQVGSQSRG